MVVPRTLIKRGTPISGMWTETRGPDQDFLLIARRPPQPATLIRGIPTSGRAMPRILVVDDEPDVVELLAEILSIGGFEPIPVLSGEAALAVYRAERPDAVLLDLLMPTMDGLGTLAAIRRIDPEAR